MGFVDKMKSWFIIEEDNSSNKKTPKAKKESAATVKTTSNKPNKTTEPSVDVAESTTGKKGKVTNKFLEILFGAVEKNNLDGFDYLEFKESLKSLEKMPMDEQTRYQSAFAMAKTMGATPEKLVTTARHYLKILKQEENKFGQALANQRTRQIGGRERQIKDLETGIHQRAQQIKKLTQEIEQSQKKLEAIKGEISGAVSKVETTKNNFIASYNVVVSQIESDIENMNKYLK